MAIGSSCCGVALLSLSLMLLLLLLMLSLWLLSVLTFVVGIRHCVLVGDVGIVAIAVVCPCCCCCGR